MKYIYFFIIALILSCDSKPYSDNRTITFYYISPYIEVPYDISCKEFEKITTKEVSHIDTVFTKKETYDFIKSKLSQVYTNGNISNCKAMVKCDSIDIYIDALGRMSINDKLIKSTYNNRKWRYTLKVTSGYYDKFKCLDDLESEYDVKEFGKPITYSPQKHNHVPKKEGIITKVLLICI